MSSILKPRSSSAPIYKSQRRVRDTCEGGGRFLTLGDVFALDVEHGIVESSAHQEFEREVVYPLAVGEGLPLLCLVPVFDQTVAESQGSSGIRSHVIAVEHATGQSGLDMADNFLFELVLVLEAVELVLGPSITLRLRDRGWEQSLVST